MNIRLVNHSIPSLEREAVADLLEGNALVSAAHHKGTTRRAGIN